MSDSDAQGGAKPLSSFRRGDRVRVVEIQGGRGMAHRILALGIIPGAELFVLESNRGPLTLCLNNTRFALGRGIADRVLVTPILSRACPSCPHEPSCDKPPQR